jgi:uncharacterized membrane protein YciS (DUF1049 family)
MENKPWQLEVTDRYQKVVGLVISLATGSLFLSITIFRDIVGVPEYDGIRNYIDDKIMTSWGLLLAAILFGCIYNYVSVKWVKAALKIKTSLPRCCLETQLDISFWLMNLCFVAGEFVLFVLFLKP